MVYHPKINNDEDLSIEKVKNILDLKYNCNLKRLKEFSTFDLIDKNNKLIVEVKNRYNNYNKYPTTMIGENKYLRAEHYFKKDYKILFIFSFLDGIYYYEYINEHFEPKKGGRIDRGEKEIKNYIFIPINKLNKL